MNYAVNLRVAATHLSRVARRRPDRVTLADLLEAACGDDQKLRIVGDKLPNYVFMLDRLVTLPRLLRLVIYRDCRDLTSSYLARIRTDWKHQRWARYVDTAEKVARRWVHAIEHMESHAEDLYLVRYEDIVANPLAELRPIAEWLGVELSGFDTKIVLSASVGKHKRGLTARELDDVLRVAGPTMERLSYRIA